MTQKEFSLVFGLTMKTIFLPIITLAVSILHCSPDPMTEQEDQPLRIATFNIQDIRTSDLLDGSNPRLMAAAELVSVVRPDIFLVNEITFDMVDLDGEEPGMNGQRFADNYLVSTIDIKYTAWMPPTNTGISSGFDLDNNGLVGSAYPPIAKSDADGNPPRQSQHGRAFGNDSWGFGTYPGQYGMAIFVRDGLTIDSSAIQTFQTFRWADLPDALRPMTDDGNPWYDDSEWAGMRLSSKNHSIVPVNLENGESISIVASHPTPPAFDGSEMRNKKRNHDEIRLLAEIIGSDNVIMSDQGSRANIDATTHFVIIGDLNADPDEGSSYENPIMTHLFSSPRVNSNFTPVAADSTLGFYPNLDADDTAEWGLRVDYVLPSSNVIINGSGVHRLDPDADVSVSDHFPVWIDIVVPASIRK